MNPRDIAGERKKKKKKKNYHHHHYFDIVFHRVPTARLWRGSVLGRPNDQSIGGRSPLLSLWRTNGNCRYGGADLLERTNHRPLCARDQHPGRLPVARGGSGHGFQNCPEWGVESGATRGVTVSCFPSLPPMLECGFESRLGLESSGLSMWLFLTLVDRGFLRVLRFPPHFHRSVV